MKKFLLPTVCLFALGVTSAFAFETGEERKNRVLAQYEKTGEFEQCLTHRNIKSAYVLDNFSMLFKMRDNSSRLAHFDVECHNLTIRRQFSIDYSNNKLCKNNTITTNLSECHLSEFEVLKRLPRDS